MFRQANFRCIRKNDELIYSPLCRLSSCYSIKNRPTSSGLLLFGSFKQGLCAPASRCLCCTIKSSVQTCNISGSEQSMVERRVVMTRRASRRGSFLSRIMNGMGRVRFPVIPEGPCILLISRLKKGWEKMSHHGAGNIFSGMNYALSGQAVSLGFQYPGQMHPVTRP